MTGRWAYLVRRVALICALAIVFAAAEPALAQRGGAFKTTPAGLQYRDLQLGEGPAAALGDIAEIHFVGWLDKNGARGRQIYSTREDGRPVSFVLGTDRVMEAWNEGVVGMRVGGRRLIMAPPHLAYGDRAIGDVIPRRAFITMIIELIALEKAPE